MPILRSLVLRMHRTRLVCHLYPAREAGKLSSQSRVARNAICSRPCARSWDVQ